MKEKEKFCLSKKVFYILFSLILISTIFYLYSHFLNYLNKNKLAKNPRASVKNQDRTKKPNFMKCGAVGQVCCTNNYCDQKEGLTACINGKCVKVDKLNTSEALSQGFKCGDYDQPCCLEKINEKKELYYQLKCKEDLICSKNKLIEVDPLKTNEENINKIMEEISYSRCVYDEKKVCGSTNQPCCGTVETDPEKRCFGDNYCFLKKGFDFPYLSMCLPKSNLVYFKPTFGINNNKITFSFFLPLDYYKIEAVINCNNKKFVFFDFAEDKNYYGMSLGLHPKGIIEQDLFNSEKLIDNCDLINNYKKLTNNKLVIKVDINVKNKDDKLFFTKQMGYYSVDITSLLPLLKKLEQAKISPTKTYYSNTKSFYPSLKLTPTPTLKNN